LRTKRNIEAGFTTVIHATLGHDETRATCSLILHEGGHYLVVRDLEETGILCNYLEGNLDAEELMVRLGKGTSPGFDPDRDLRQVALINQTTMLASESREIGVRIEESLRRAGGETAVEARFRDFDTICNATQENQDAVIDLVTRHPIDLMLVVGGFNSSNTKNLARIAESRGVPTYHIEDAANLTADAIVHQPVPARDTVATEGWLPAEGKIVVGVSAGASTPDTRLAAVIERLAELAGVAPEDLLAP
jgi:4-hydroxy-3-methylbut-2-enyl diphosphate reductase